MNIAAQKDAIQSKEYYGQVNSQNQITEIYDSNNLPVIPLSLLKDVEYIEEKVSSN